MKSNKTPKFVKILVICLLSWISFVFISGCITQNIIFLDPGWGYDPTAPYSELFNVLEISLTIPSLVISYLSYLIIIFLICTKRTLKSHGRSRKEEIRILLQSTFITTYLAILVITWNPDLFPFVKFLDVSKKRNRAIINGLWILHCYINPAMIIIFNKFVFCFLFFIKLSVFRPIRESCKKVLNRKCCGSNSISVLKPSNSLFT
ncbi:hypothetical protein CRE_07837 [Caenorhabditis remanei]|uniref:G-protein coupled receptors family 1 profile domain-containing protein n=1 Tax=Caenorhabditis remanei TaxID=31234 RepID=E3NEL4_CAERE|nr:hypothetical protein CRE_07837 [Caenorhabditis remanei]